MDERVEFDRLIEGSRDAREERVVRTVMSHARARGTPRPDLAESILAVGGPAFACALTVVLAIWLVPRRAPAMPTRPATVGAALGLPQAAERAIHAESPPPAEQLLAAFQEGR